MDMTLCLNDVVRGTFRDGHKFDGLRVAVDQAKLEQIVRTSKERPGIVEILVQIITDRAPKVDDDVMLLAPWPVISVP